MRYISGSFILETLREIENLYDLGDTSFLMNIRSVRETCSPIHIYTHTFVYFSLEVSALLKLPVQLAPEEKIILSPYEWLFCNHDGPNQFKPSCARISMEPVPMVFFCVR